MTGAKAPEPFAAGNLFERWLPEVASDTIFVDESDTGLIAEARGNLWGFSLTKEEAISISEEDVIAFLYNVQDARQHQILERFGTAHPMTFYCWSDELAGEIQFSLVSASHGRTGFSGKTEDVPDPGDIVRKFLGNPHLTGIPLDEFKSMTREEIESHEEPPTVVPKVWSTTLAKDPR